MYLYAKDRYYLKTHSKRYFHCKGEKYSQMDTKKKFMTKAKIYLNTNIFFYKIIAVLVFFKSLTN